MEFIEGAHLGEHFNSLKEKKERFQESRIWDILLQVRADNSTSFTVNTETPKCFVLFFYLLFFFFLKVIIPFFVLLGYSQMQ